MITMKCSHKFCSHCMKIYVDGKVQSSQVPIRCPQLKCKYIISANECKSFLPVTSYESLEKALVEANVLNSDKFYCPYSNCSALLDPSECFSTRASLSSRLESSCVECTFCERFICVECGVPWHSSMSCEEYRNLLVEERDVGDLPLHRLAENQRWRRCQQCQRMIEHTHGCYHMTCWYVHFLLQFYASRGRSLEPHNPNNRTKVTSVAWVGFSHCWVGSVSNFQKSKNLVGLVRGLETRTKLNKLEMEPS